MLLLTSLAPWLGHTGSQKNSLFVLEPIYIPWALNTGTCIQQGDLFYSAVLPRNQCQPQLTQEKLRRGFRKNAGEQTGRVKISKEEIADSKRSMYGLLQALKGKPLSAVFSPDGTLISASVAPNRDYCFFIVFFFFLSEIAFRTYGQNLSCGLRKRDVWYNDLWNE